MKVVKAVSLCMETAPIASKMANFSQWIRIGLRQYERNEDLASETMRRIRWARAATLLASALEEASKKIDPEWEGTFDDLLSKAYNQTTLEEF